MTECTCEPGNTCEVHPITEADVDEREGSDIDWVNHVVEDDPVHHPRHYRSHPSGVECIEITRLCGFNLGNAIKYIWRAWDKGNPHQDLAKALWYLRDLVAHDLGWAPTYQAHRLLIEVCQHDLNADRRMFLSYLADGQVPTVVEALDAYLGGFA